MLWGRHEPGQSERTGVVKGFARFPPHEWGDVDALGGKLGKLRKRIRLVKAIPSKFRYRKQAENIGNFCWLNQMVVETGI